MGSVSWRRRLRFRGVIPFPPPAPPVRGDRPVPLVFPVPPLRRDLPDPPDGDAPPNFPDFPVTPLRLFLPPVRVPVDAAVCPPWPAVLPRFPQFFGLSFPPRAWPFRPPVPDPPPRSPLFFPPRPSLLRRRPRAPRAPPPPPRLLRPGERDCIRYREPCPRWLRRFRVRRLLR